MSRPITITLTILSLPLVLGLLRLWPPASTAGGPLSAVLLATMINHDQKGEIEVKTTETNTLRTQIRSLLLGSFVFAILLITFQHAAGQYRNPYNGVSHTSQLAKLYDMTRTWNSNLFREMNRYQATKNRLKDLARSYVGRQGTIARRGETLFGVRNAIGR